MCREVDIFMFLPKNCFLRSSSGYVESNPSEKIDKNQLFSEAECFFSKKPKYGRKQHLSLETPMDYWNAILTKLAKVFAKKRLIFGSKSENKYEVNYLPQNVCLSSKSSFLGKGCTFCSPAKKKFAKVGVFPLKVQKNYTIIDFPKKILEKFPCTRKLQLAQSWGSFITESPKTFDSKCKDDHETNR